MAVGVFVTGMGIEYAEACYFDGFPTFEGIGHGSNHDSYDFVGFWDCQAGNSCYLTSHFPASSWVSL